MGTMRALALHDYIVSRPLEKLAGKIDIVHAWPDGALRTLKVAARLAFQPCWSGQRPYRYAYESVAAGGARIGVELPQDKNSPQNGLYLNGKERNIARQISCYVSEFVARTFRIAVLQEKSC